MFVACRLALGIDHKQWRFQYQLLTDVGRQTAWHEREIVGKAAHEAHPAQQQGKADAVMVAATLQNLVTVICRKGEIPKEFCARQVLRDLLKARTRMTKGRRRNVKR